MQALQPKMVLSRTEHRPYPMPAGPWVLFMSWHDLLFMHWPVHEEALRSLIPPALHLDTFGGSAWLSVTPFRMTGVRPRFLPSVPPLSNFPELNVPGKANLGFEGVAFVPDTYLVQNGFVDQSIGAAYVPSDYPGHGSGLFFAALFSRAFRVVRIDRHYAHLMLRSRATQVFARLPPPR